MKERRREGGKEGGRGTYRDPSIDHVQAVGGLACCVRCSELRDELGGVVATVVGDDGGELREGGRERGREGCECCSTKILIQNKECIQKRSGSRVIRRK